MELLWEYCLSLIAIAINRLDNMDLLAHLQYREQIMAYSLDIKSLSPKARLAAAMHFYLAVRPEQESIHPDLRQVKINFAKWVIGKCLEDDGEDIVASLRDDFKAEMHGYYRECCSRSIFGGGEGEMGRFISRFCDVKTGGLHPSPSKAFMHPHADNPGDDSREQTFLGRLKNMEDSIDKAIVLVVGSCVFESNDAAAEPAPVYASALAGLASDEERTVVDRIESAADQVSYISKKLHMLLKDVASDIKETESRPGQQGRSASFCT